MFLRTNDNWTIYPGAPLTIHHSPLTTHHSPLTTHHSPLTTHHSPRAHLEVPLRSPVAPRFTASILLTAAPQLLHWIITRMTRKGGSPSRGILPAGLLGAPWARHVRG